MNSHPDTRPRYTIARRSGQGDIDWSLIAAASIAHFHTRSQHQPQATARAVYDEQAIDVRFEVEDRYVKSVHTEANAMVCRDSCVEFFIRPAGVRGYVNFEANCGGTLHASFVPLSEDDAPLFDQRRFLSPERGGGIVTAHSMPSVVEPEITQACAWHLQMRIPWSVMTDLTGSPPPRPGEVWTGNFYKCGDWTSHPHWGSWAAMDAQLNFHRPQFFGELIFAPAPQTT